MSTACPCHSTRPYAVCCRPFHSGRWPPTPLALMRSRYAAYALGKVSYILKTERLEQAEPAAVRRTQLRRFCDQTEFIGLKVVAEESLNEHQATVTFQAILFQNGQDASFTERSLFERRQGRWFYVG